MKLKSALKYQMYEAKKPIIIYYTVILALIVLMAASLLLVRYYSWYNGVVNLNFQGASIIFLFILGLNAFKSAFYMLTANGISRKTMFRSFFAGAAIISAGMALIDSIISLGLQQFAGSESRSLLQVMFPEQFAAGGIGAFGAQLAWLFFSYICAIMAGYLITTLYYRMSKAVKLLVSIGVPALVLIGLPIADSGILGYALLRVSEAIVAFCTSSPLMGMATSAVLTAVFGVVAWLALRRAPVKG